MERKHFIKTSLFGAAGLTLLPTVVKLMSFENNAFIVLNENHHIRHGYYGSEFMVNRIGRYNELDIRLDRFSNPEGDMTLIDVKYHDESLRIALTDNTFIVEHDSKIEEIDLESVDGKLGLNRSEKVCLTTLDYLKTNDIDVKYALVVDNQECRIFNELTASYISSRDIKGHVVAFL